MSMWVCSLVVLGLVAAPGVRAMDDEMKEVARALRDSCLGETGLNEAVINDVNAGADLPPDPTLKCYIKCVMESAGMMSDGVVDVETVLAMLPDEMRKKTEASMRACGSKKGSDDCDTAWQTQACWQKANKADFFLV